MNVLIIEDENQTAKRLVNLIHRYDASIEILGQFASVKKTLEYFSQTNNHLPDLLFLDVHLEDDDGFKILENIDSSIPVIFTTAYSEYSLKAFKSFSIDYLLKPIDYQQLCEALDKYKRIVSPTESVSKSLVQETPQISIKERFLVSWGVKLLSIPVEQVAYFSYEQKAAFLVTNDQRRFTVDYSLDRLVQLTDPNKFFRVNRSILVCLSAISSIVTYSAGKLKLELIPEPGYEVFVSIDRVTEFKDWLGK
ncbi:LytR/AlgR family response regulator transcription factor [Dyadobacter psychrotolerans]|uniref:Response regulator transcription factor n=1 Tax=Dyadobacter psychrotolerans TaxID=2541721 RepID=A0A4R5DXI1_9BACT|nr:LytTR family DNA-binding domain-containing protein [Dyadobacter psychrotolerans]TDE17170.1 response regulator transcription factor [Dyadobacter psychrotolerans]